MLIPITNEPMHYAWGSKTAIAGITERLPSGSPEAEMWLGAHPGSPSRLVHPDRVWGHLDLAAFIAAEPVRALGPQLAPTRRLPFLMKILAAESPLSIQAHPTAERAASGFDRENLLGIPLGAAQRNYRDPHHKPEMIVALSDRFDALCGFRPLDEVHRLLDRVWSASTVESQIRPDFLDPLSTRLSGAGGLQDAVSWVLRGGTQVATLVQALLRLGDREVGDPSIAEMLCTVRDLGREFPGDPGIALSLLIRRVTLRRGEALYLPAGNVHAYLRGTGIEVMATSDNVLRGGLTSKHVDVAEFVSVLDFAAHPVPLLTPEEPVPGIKVFRPSVPDFALVQAALLERDLELELSGPAIVLAIGGNAEVKGLHDAVSLAPGCAAFITPDEGRLEGSGSAELFIATTGTAAEPT